MSKEILRKYIDIINEHEVLNEEILEEGMLQRLAGLALGTVLALGPKIGQADTVFSYLDPNTNQMQTVLDMSKVPATAKVVLAIDTDTNQVMTLKGGAKGQPVQPDPAAVKQAQQPQQAQTQQSTVQRDSIFGLTPDEVVQNNPNFKIQKEKLTNIGPVGKISNYLGINKFSVKASGKMQGPYNIPSNTFITFDKENKSNGVAYEVPVSKLPKEWQDSGILGYNRGQAENLIKELIKNAPPNLGQRVGQVKIRDGEGREIGGINIGYGTAAPTGSGVVGVGTGFNLFGSTIKDFIVTQDFENGKLVLPFLVQDDKYYRPNPGDWGVGYGSVYIYVKDPSSPKDDLNVTFE